MAGMKWFQGTYTQRFNAMFNCCGHLFQGRYKALPIEAGRDGPYFRAVGNYIHLNPFRAGLAGHGMDKPLEAYRWSSYPAYVGRIRKMPDWLERARLLDACGLDLQSADVQADYRELLEYRMRGNAPDDSAAELVTEIREITPEITAMAGAAPSGFSSGGMATKIAAARIALAAGCRMAIATGRVAHPLRVLADGAACSWFLPRSSPRTARKRWIAGALGPAGAITVDDGAAKALAAGKSLLPAGVVSIKGDFEPWPLITESKDALADADDFAETEDKLGDFDVAPFAE